MRICSNIANRPPGASTRWTWAKTTVLRGMFIPTCTITAASNEASSKGADSPGVSHVGDPVAESHALGEAVAASTKSGVRSMPVTSAPAIAAIREVPPMPQPTSSRRTPGADLEPVEHVLRGGGAAGVQLVDREQVGRPEVLGVDPGLRQRRQDRPAQVPAAVVGRDQLADVHRPHLPLAR